MRFSLTSDHRFYFEKTLSIEFEQLLKARQLKELNSAIDMALAKRVGIAEVGVSATPHRKLVLQGRDLFRDSSLVKRVAANPDFAQIMADLLFKAPIRLAYDQLLIPKDPSKDGVYSGTPTLEEISGFQGILGGMILCVKGVVQEEQEQEQELVDGVIFPEIAGSAVFFGAACPIPFDQLDCRSTDSRYILVAYGQKNLMYARLDKDPHVHYLKTLGYAFGDSLKKDHPLLVTAPS